MAVDKTADKKIDKRKDKKVQNKLSLRQAEYLLTLVAEGLRYGDIVAKTTKFDEPFTLTQQHLYSYRKAQEINLEELRKEREFHALREGLAVKANRVKMLEELAMMFYVDLKDKEMVWLNDKKSIGTDEPYDFIKFNGSEIEQLRGVLDDIAKETGGRTIKTDITSGNKPIKGYVSVDPNSWDQKVKEKSNEQ